MNRLRSLSCALLLVTVSFGACTFHSEPKPEITRLEKKLKETEIELTAVEEQMKDPVADRGTKERLSGQRELIRSRIERIKENLTEATKNAGD